MYGLISRLTRSGKVPDEISVPVNRWVVSRLNAKKCTNNEKPPAPPAAQQSRPPNSEGDLEKRGGGHLAFGSFFFATD